MSDKDTATPILKQVYNKLRKAGQVHTQQELVDALNLSKGYVSVLMKSVGDLPPTIKEKLHLTYHISTTWLDSQGQKGDWLLGGESSNVTGRPVEELTPERMLDRLANLLETSGVEISRLTTLHEQGQGNINKLTGLLEKSQENITRLTLSLVEKDKQIADLMKIVAQKNGAEK